MKKQNDNYYARTLKWGEIIVFQTHSHLNTTISLKIIVLDEATAAIDAATSTLENQFHCVRCVKAFVFVFVFSFACAFVCSLFFSQEGNSLKLGFMRDW